LSIHLKGHYEQHLALFSLWKNLLCYLCYNSSEAFGCNPRCEQGLSPAQKNQQAVSNHFTTAEDVQSLLHNIGKSRLPMRLGNGALLSHWINLWQQRQQLTQQEERKPRVLISRVPPLPLRFLLLSWRRGGAVAPGQLGFSASSHFKTSAGTKPVQRVQLK